MNVYIIGRVLHVKLIKNSLSDYFFNSSPYFHIELPNHWKENFWKISCRGGFNIILHLVCTPGIDSSQIKCYISLAFVKNKRLLFVGGKPHATSVRSSSHTESDTKTAKRQKQPLDSASVFKEGTTIRHIMMYNRKVAHRPILLYRGRCFTVRFVHCGATIRCGMKSEYLSRIWNKHT